MVSNTLLLISIFITCISATNQLVGYEGCSTNQGGQKEKIDEAFQQAKDIFDVIRDASIDWNSAAAVEFLGPPGFNQNMQSVIQGIIHDLAKVNGGSIHDDLSINVRCDDWDNYCNGGDFAYTSQRGPSGSNYDTGVINFCPKFFNSPSLSEVVERGRNEFDWQRKYNMNSYDNARAVTMIHELLHVDWVVSAERYGSNLHVKDWQVEFYDHDNHDKKEHRYVYGARLAKTLARWNDRTSTPQPGRFIARSAENLALYPLAIYMTQQLGAYPHLPIVNTKPNKEPNFHNENAFEIDSNGNIFANTTYPQDISGLSEDGGFEVATIESFLDDSLYPQPYLDDWHHWANPLTQSSNFHNQLHDGWITTAIMQQSTWSQQDVETHVDGGYISVFDGWVKYWSPSCPNAEATFMWPAGFSDVYLKSDGYIHDSNDKIIGTIKINC